MEQAEWTVADEIIDAALAAMKRGDYSRATIRTAIDACLTRAGTFDPALVAMCKAVRIWLAARREQRETYDFHGGPEKRMRAADQALEDALHRVGLAASAHGVRTAETDAAAEVVRLTKDAESLVERLRVLVDGQELGDAVVLVQRQLFNRAVGTIHRLTAALAAARAQPTAGVGEALEALRGCVASLEGYRDQYGDSQPCDAEAVARRLLAASPGATTAPTPEVRP